jgi:hypothetical protein
MIRDSENIYIYIYIMSYCFYSRQNGFIGGNKIRVYIRSIFYTIQIMKQNCLLINPAMKYITFSVKQKI